MGGVYENYDLQSLFRQKLSKCKKKSDAARFGMSRGSQGVLSGVVYELKYLTAFTWVFFSMWTCYKYSLTFENLFQPI